MGLDDQQIGQAVVVEVAHEHQAEVAGGLGELEGEVGGRREEAALAAAVNRDRLAAPHLDEVGAAVAGEVAGELRRLAEAQVVEVQAELAGEIQTLDPPEPAVRSLAPEMEVDADRDRAHGQDAHRLEE